MSQKDSEKLNEEKNLIIQSMTEEKNCESEKDEIQDISEEMLAEDFDFFKEESKRLNNMHIIEETIEEIKKENNKDNDLDEYIKDCIEILEEYSSIFSFEDLIYDPEYTLKTFMKSLKKVINFKYFYTKFTLLKDKNEHKEDKEEVQTTESENNNKIQYDKEKNNKEKKTTEPQKDKKRNIKKKECKENKDEKKECKENKDDKKECKENKNDKNECKENKDEKKECKENKNDKNECKENKEGKKECKENKNDKNECKENKEGKKESKENKDDKNECKENKNEKKECKENKDEKKECKENKDDKNECKENKEGKKECKENKDDKNECKENKDGKKECKENKEGKKECKENKDDKKECKENKNDKNECKENKDDKNECKENKEGQKECKENKDDKNECKENKNDKNEFKENKEGKKECKENKNDKNECKENKNDKNECKENKDDKNECKKSKQNKENLYKELKNDIGDFKRDNRKKKLNILEKRKNDFILKLSIKEKKRIFSNTFKGINNKSDEKQIKGISEKDKSEEESKLNISFSENSKEKTNTLINEKSDTLKEETLSKLEEYKLLNFDNILSIINNNANTEEEELIEGKNFESKVRKYFQVVLDICSDKFLSVYKNSRTTIQGLYKYYEDLIEKDKAEKNDNIFGTSKRKNEYNKIEFDLMSDNISKNIISKIIDVFKSSIIAKNWDENIGEATQYQIIGEVAKNILNQSIDKYKQIGKTIDMLLIEQYLTLKDLMDLDKSFVNEIIKEYSSLKLDVNQNKFIFLFTDGSFVELKKALLFKESELENMNNDYQSVDIKSLFPIKNKRRYCKNIIYLNKIIERLNTSKIPYIIFYVGEELNNGLERILINYIKNKKDIDMYKSIISKIESNEKLISKNISQSFFIKTINKSLKMLNKNKIFDIIKNIINIPENLCYDYFSFLYENLIEKKRIEKKHYILLFFKDLKIPSSFEKQIKDFNNKDYITKIEIVFTTEEELLAKYSKYKDKKISKIFIIVNETKTETNNYFNDYIQIKDFEVKDFRNLYQINFEGINNDKVKEIIKKYILSNYCHFSEEIYVNLDIFHKKIIFDIKNLEKDLPIKFKEIGEDKIFSEKARNLFDKFFSDDIMKQKSDEILALIKNCIGTKLYDYLLGTREEYLKKNVNINLRRISEHILCFSIYDKFFMEYLSLEIK